MDLKTLTATAAILFNNLVKVLNDVKSSQSELEDALTPFAVIQWNKSLMDSIGIHRINRLFGRLKRSSIPKTTLRTVIAHFHTSMADKGAIIPPQFMEWRDIIAKYSLHAVVSYSTWVPIIQFLVDEKISTPQILSELTNAELNLWIKDSPWAELISSLWQSVRIEFHVTTDVNKLSLTFRNNNYTLVEALKSGSSSDSTFATEISESKADLGLPSAFEKLGPAAKINALQQATPDSQHLLRFLSAGAQANILERVRSTLPSVASGVKCYLSFCSLLGIAPFPPSANIVARWSALFSPGKTYSLYVGHLNTACQLLEIDSSWRTDTIRDIAKGLAKKAAGKERFHNSLAPSLLDRLIRSESWESELARLAYVTFLFMLRLPSEALILTRAMSDEQLLSPGCPSSPAVIGLREFQGEHRLVLKLAKRKNKKSLFTAMRPCFCGPNMLIPKHNCPIHQFWAAVVQHTAPGESLFPNLLSKNITRILRKALTNINVVEAERYSTHCFRKGAATAILNSGATLAQIMKTGGWVSGSFKVYLDLHRAEEVSMKNILSNESPESSAGSPSASSTSSATISESHPPKIAKVDLYPYILNTHWVTLLISQKYINPKNAYKGIPYFEPNVCNSGSELGFPHR